MDDQVFGFPTSNKSATDSKLPTTNMGWVKLGFKTGQKLGAKVAKTASDKKK